MEYFSDVFVFGGTINREIERPTFVELDFGAISVGRKQ